MDGVGVGVGSLLDGRDDDAGISFDVGNDVDVGDGLLSFPFASSSPLSAKAFILSFMLGVGWCPFGFSPVSSSLTISSTRRIRSVISSLSKKSLTSLRSAFPSIPLSSLLSMALCIRSPAFVRQVSAARTSPASSRERASCDWLVAVFTSAAADCEECRRMDWTDDLAAVFIDETDLPFVPPLLPLLLGKAGDDGVGVGKTETLGIVAGGLCRR